VFETLNDDGVHHKDKKLKSETHERVANRRKLYKFAESKHPEKPAYIDIGKPHDLNPSSYEDTKMIIRNESKKLEYQNTEMERDHGWLLFAMAHLSNSS